MSSHILQELCVVRNGPKMLTCLINGLDSTLSDSKKKYSDKVSAVISAWERCQNSIPQLKDKFKDHIESIIEEVYEHTLQVVLRGDWPKLYTENPVYKKHLETLLCKCVKELGEHPAYHRCNQLLDLVQNPWNRQALQKIFNGNSDVDDEVEAFFCAEKGELLTMRLKILCEDRCEDFALKLAAACLRSLRSSENMRSATDVDQENFIMDVYIVLLYKFKRTKDVIAQLKLMELNKGLELVERLSGERPTRYGTARIWRNSTKAAELVIQYLVTTGMVKPMAEVTSDTLERILDCWVRLQSKQQSDNVMKTLPDICRKLIEPAESALHIYIFCEVLVRHVSQLMLGYSAQTDDTYGNAIKSLVIELYIRALTTDMNELENQKAKSNKEKVKETEKRLSDHFLKLADFVGDHPTLTRECVLTAFSFHPSRSCFERIQRLAETSGKIDVKPDQQVEQQQQPPLETQDQDQVSQVNKEMLSGEDLGLPRQLRDDLLVVLNSQRFQLLNWSLEWPELSSLCEKYIENAGDLRNTNKELKYLNPDYSNFKRKRPNDRDLMYAGIEKGYEHLAESTTTEEEQEFSTEESQPQVKKKSQQRKTSTILESNSSDETELEIAPKPRKKKQHQQRVRAERLIVSTDDENEDDIGTGMFSRVVPKIKPKSRGRPRNTENLPLYEETANRSVDLISASQFLSLMNEGAGSDNSTGNNITIFPADLDKSKCQTIKTPSFYEGSLLLRQEKRSDPQVLKTLRQFRKNLAKPKFDENNPATSNNFAPMLSTIDLNPQLVLKRAEPMEGSCSRVGQSQEKPKVKRYYKRKPQAKCEVLQEQMKKYFIGANMQPKVINTYPSHKEKVLSRMNDFKTLTKLTNFSVPTNVPTTVNIVQLQRNAATQQAQANNVGTAMDNRPGHQTTNTTTMAAGQPVRVVQNQETTNNSNHQRVTDVSVGTITGAPSQEIRRALTVVKHINRIAAQSNNNNNNNNNNASSNNSEQMQFIVQLQQSLSSDSKAQQQPQQQQQQQQAGLPKFDQAFGRTTICANPSTLGQLLKQSTTSISGNSGTSSAPTAGTPVILANRVTKLSATGVTKVIQTTVTQNQGQIAVPQQMFSQLGNLLGCNGTGRAVLRVIKAPAVSKPILTAQKAPTPTSAESTPMQQNTPSMSNTSTNQSTEEALREFESVLEQVKERSTQSTTTCETNTVETQTIQSSAPTVQKLLQGQLNQRLLTPVSVSSPTFQQSSIFANGNTLTFPKQDIGVQKKLVQALISQSTNNSGGSPQVVVFTRDCPTSASPALSINSQSSGTSPCVTPSPTPISGKSISNSSPNAKIVGKKSTGAKILKTITATTTTAVTTPTSTSVSTQSSSSGSMTPKVAVPIAKPPPKPQEDEETTQKIYQILSQYAEELRNSPDLINKPAPRRRSNPPTNPNQSGSKRKKSGSGSKSKSASGSQHASEQSPSSEDLGRTMGCSSEDSCDPTTSSIANVQSPANFSASEETQHGSLSCMTNSSDQNTQDVKPEVATPKIEVKTETSDQDSDNQPPSQPQQQQQPQQSKFSGFVTTGSGSSSGPVQKTSMNEALASMKPGAAVIVSGTNFMFPMGLVKGGQQIAVVSSGGGPVSNALVLQSLLAQANRVGQVKRFGVIPSQGQQQQQQQPQQQSSIIVNKAPGGGTPIGIFQQQVNSSKIAGSKQATSVVCLVSDKRGGQALSSLINASSGQATATTTTATMSLGEFFKARGLMEAKHQHNSGTITSNNKIVAIKQETIDQFSDNANDETNKIKAQIRQEDTVKNEEKPPKIVPNHIIANVTVSKNSDTKPPFLSSQSSCLISATSNSTDSIETVPKLENGVLCGNARLQEAWEIERKGSPDAPWRYPNPPTTSLNSESINSSAHNSVLHPTNKQGQQSELASYSQIYGNKKLISKVATLRNAALIEKELKLQKSLSEECEDLGVEIPSTSDLFPEADLGNSSLNHSPSYDHSSQEAADNVYSFGLDPVSSENINPIGPVTSKIMEKNKVTTNKKVLKPGEQSKKPIKRPIGDGFVQVPNKQVKTLSSNLDQDEAFNNSLEFKLSTKKKLSKELASRQLTHHMKDTSNASPSSFHDLDLIDHESALPCHKIYRSTLADTNKNLKDESDNNINLSVPDSKMSSDSVSLPSPLSPLDAAIPTFAHKPQLVYSNVRKHQVKKPNSYSNLNWHSASDSTELDDTEEDDSELNEEDEDDEEYVADEYDFLDDEDLDEDSSLDSDLNISNGLQNNFSKRRKARDSDVNSRLNNKKMKLLECYDMTDDEDTSQNASGPELGSDHRRSSSRGHVKKNCPCCNDPSERSKPKKLPSLAKNETIKKKTTSPPQLVSKKR